MCGLLGVHFNSVSNTEIELTKQLVLHSQIRGKHATGISYLKNNQLVTLKESIPADMFVRKYDIAEFVNDNSLTLIVHCRYSTSDLRFNQPISNDNLSIAHNGVITQELYEHWESLYGYKCQTENDSEIILHTVEAGKSVLEQWQDSSLAVLELYKTGIIRFYRNGKRPLHYNFMNNGIIISSTRNIFERNGLSSTMTKPNVYYEINTKDSLLVTETDTKIPVIDLQEQYGL
jgi:glutamine phosphoribosylpyrophosphate amidotransferase